MLIEGIRILGLSRKTGHCHSYCSGLGAVSIFAPVPQSPDHTSCEEDRMTAAHAELALQRNSEHRAPGHFLMHSKHTCYLLWRRLYFPNLSQSINIFGKPGTRGSEILSCKCAEMWKTNGILSPNILVTKDWGFLLEADPLAFSWM